MVILPLVHFYKIYFLSNFIWAYFLIFFFLLQAKSRELQLNWNASFFFISIN